MEDKKYCVYKHTSPQGLSYIGVTSRNPPNLRWQNGFGYKGREPFFSDIQKYGWESFSHEILEEGLSESEAFEKESYYILLYRSNVSGSGYNSTSGGKCGFSYCDETLSKMTETANTEKRKAEVSQSTKHAWKTNRDGYIAALKKAWDDPERKAKAGEIQRKVQKRQDVVQKIRETRLNEWSDPVKRASRISAIKEAVNRPEAKKKRSMALKSKWQDPEYRQKTVGVNCKKVKCVETEMVFQSIKEASKWAGCSVSNISCVLRGITKKAAGYTWERVE